jgi:3-deoxy-manno-octulosonate cytidylyltransferase (CMP-KDO synthetase)
MKKNYLIVIPARYNSSRLPGKPLIKILGIPMILRTYYQCLKIAPKNKILVATDDDRILNLCKINNVNCVMTSKKCLTGTDRIAEVSKKIKAKVYINVQGDEPICNTRDLKKLIKLSQKKPNIIINGYTKISNKNQFFSGHTPKVVFRKDGRLLYQSRAGIPTTKKHEFKLSWRQVCIYSLPYKALQIFSSQKKKTNLEYIEDCELLRFLELGLEVHMIRMSNKSISVDTKSDIKKVIKALKKNNN